VNRVLLVDDDPILRRALSITLRARGYQVDTAADGAESLRLAAAHHPDLIILDLGLPDLDGIEVLHAVRGWSTVPVIVLSAREGGADKVEALDAGADDYVTKPFAIDELLARARAALRRAAAPVDSPALLHTEAFTVDLAAKRVTKDDVDVRLTPTEWGLLEVLARNPGKVVSHSQLLHDVWGPNYSKETNYLRVYMAQLRRKLEPSPSQPRHLLTEPGFGYRLQP